jgi:5-methylcytosine-specific restriction endonuclease McrA
MNLVGGPVAASKVCPKCGTEKPLAEFHRDKNRKDGRYCYCKPCAVSEVRRYTARPEWRARKREYDRERVSRLRDKLKAQMRARYERTKPERLAEAKEWARKNPEKRRLICQSYKHRRRAVEHNGMSWKELREWKAAQPKICHWCGIKCAHGYVVDHIRPLARGGKHEARNLAISCRPCNAKKAAKDPIDFAREMGKLL